MAFELMEAPPIHCGKMPRPHIPMHFIFSPLWLDFVKMWGL